MTSGTNSSAALSRQSNQAPATAFNAVTSRYDVTPALRPQTQQHYRHQPQQQQQHRRHSTYVQPTYLQTYHSKPSPSHSHHQFTTKPLLTHSQTAPSSTRLTSHAQNVTSHSQHVTSHAQDASSVRLVVLYNFQAQAPDDLSVTRDETLLADVTKQDNQDWVWVTSPTQGRSGYIPRTYAKIFNDTSGS